MRRPPRWLEEILPFLAYLCAKLNHEAELEALNHGRAVSAQIERARDCYRDLTLDEIKSCLASEHERASALTEKTFKFGAALATALVIASTAITLISEDLRDTTWKVLTLATSLPAFIYVATAGILGLSAMRVQRRFGVGAAALAERKGRKDSDLVTIAVTELVLQERANIINAARNEAAYMSLRNGLLLVLIALSMALLGVALQ